MTNPNRPGLGDFVRIVEVHPGDPSPHAKVGDVIGPLRHVRHFHGDMWHVSEHEPIDRTRPNQYTTARVERVASPTLMAADPYATPRAVPVFMSTDSATRKLLPVAAGCLAYFPDALKLVAFVSRVGNEKHNPGQPLHWDKSKSQDEPDCEVRHMLDHLQGTPPDPGLEPLGELGHLASKAWRALAHLQRACDAVRSTTAPAEPRPVGMVPELGMGYGSDAGSDDEPHADGFAPNIDV